MKIYSILTSAIIFIVFILCMVSIGHASSGMISDYSYMKTHNIAGSQDGDLDDYQLKFIIHSGDGVDHGGNVYLGGHSQSWPYDIRFTNANGALLNYWIESYDPDSAIVWVKVDRIPADPAITTIMLYYGKLYDTGASNGYNTFVFFDDFSGTGLDSSRWKQTVGAGMISVNNGILTITGNGIDVANVSSIPTFGTGTALRAKLMSAHTSGKLDEGINWWTDYSNAIIVFYSANNANMYEKYRAASDNSENYLPLEGWSANTWHIQDIERFDSDKISYLVDDSNSVNEMNANSVPTGKSNLRLFADVSGSRISADWILIRNITDNEPVQTGWNAEPTTQTTDLQWIVIGAIVIILIIVILLLIVMAIMIGYMLSKGKK